jgi:hypothetical protein
LATSAACSISLGGYADGESAAADSSTGGSGDSGFQGSDSDVEDVSVDGAKAPPLDATADAGDTAGPNLETNGTFDTDVDPWNSYQGALTLSGLAHGGAHSLRVCVNVLNDIYSADDSQTPGPGTLGATYRARAWIQADPEASTPSYIAIALRNVVDEPSFKELESLRSPQIPVPAIWTQIETTLAITKQGLLNVYIYAAAESGTCFLVDDVSLERVK